MEWVHPRSAERSQARINLMGFFATMLGQQAHWWVPARRTVVCLPLQAGAFSVANQGNIASLKMVWNLVKTVQQAAFPQIITRNFRVTHAVATNFLPRLAWLGVRIAAATCSAALVKHGAPYAPPASS